MISDRVQKKVLQVISGKEVSRVATRLWKFNYAFGILYSPQSHEFKFAASAPSAVKAITSFLDIGLSEHFSGFVAMPFDNRHAPGLLIPDEIRLEEVEHLEIQPAWSKRDLSDEHTTEAQYKTNVKNAVDAIRRSEFQKLVVSRRITLPFRSNGLEMLIDNLIDAYPQSNFCVWFTPGSGLWISVSPELLLENDGAQTIRTMALAGTQLYTGQEIKDQGWTEKEIEEQALVSRYIKAGLKENGNHFYQEKGPFTIQAGNLLHLRTDFTIMAGSKNNFLSLADILHPTSAVCGSPRDHAFNWIQTHEAFSRSFYAGTMGIVETGGLTRLIVQLRAGHVTDHNKITLYAGAGITAASNPDKEWVETEEKLKTLSRYLK